MIELGQAASHLRGLVIIGYAVFAMLPAILPSSNRTQLLSRSFIFLSLAVLVILRLPSFFLNEPLNPDEAQWLASAIKFRANMNSWLSVDTTTSGPINIYPLMWPFLLGADTGFPVARISATFLIGCTWFFLWTALSSAPAFIRFWTSACLILFMGGTQFSDFTHYSSEIVPSFLLMGAMAVAMVAVERQPSLIQIFIASICLGLVPFAKLQAAVIAAILGVILLWLVVRQAPRPYRSVVLLISGACLPAVILLLPLTVAGGVRDFWASYILHATYYVSGSEAWGRVPSSRIWPGQLRALHQILSGNLIGGYVAALSIATVLAILTLSVEVLVRGATPWRMVVKRSDTVRTIIAFVVLMASVCAVIASARAFTHYAVLLIWPLTLLVGLSWSFASSLPVRGDAEHWQLASIVGGLSVFFIGALALHEPKLNYDPEVTGAEHLFDPGQLFEGAGPGRGRIFIWGWMPQWYVWSGWMPATRDIVTYFQMVPSPARQYFRDRVLKELRNSPPDYIIDSVAPGSFGYNDPEKDGLESFPELAAFVANDYVLLSPAPSDVCRIRVFARKDIATFMERRYAVPSRVRASSALEVPPAAAIANHVNDGLVFESCSDAWLLPDGKLGEITIELARAQAIGAVEVLNTRGGSQGNRASKMVRAYAYEGGNVVFEQEVPLLRFPYWTTIDLPDTISLIDQIVVRIESYVGSDAVATSEAQSSGCCHRP
jgi:hypothetical protein